MITTYGPLLRRWTLFGTSVLVILMYTGSTDAADRAADLDSPARIAAAGKPIDHEMLKHPPISR